MEKKREKSKAVFLSLIAIFMLIIISNIVTAQECCLSADEGCIPDSDAAGFLTCETAYPDSVQSYACSDIAECTDFGCCCTSYLPDSTYANSFQCSPTNFIPGITQAQRDECPTLCDPNSAVVTGNVKYSDNTLALGASISFKNLNTNQITNTNAQDGTYSISVQGGISYQVITSMPSRAECSSTIPDLPVTGDMTQDLSLDCSASTVCIPNWQTDDWSDLANSCGTRNVWDANDCENPDPSYVKPTSTATCLPNTNTCNNDGNVDAGEECDGTNFDGKTCLDYGFADGDLICTQYCTITKQNCVDCPTDPAECALKASYCDLCPTVCGAEPSCQVSCADSTKLILAPPTLEREPKLAVNLAWDISNDPGTCEPTEFTVARCTAKKTVQGTEVTYLQECDPAIGVYTKTLVSEARTYRDVGPLTHDTSYCYNVSAVINTGLDDIYVSDFKCRIMPDKRCEGIEDTYFCEVNDEEIHVQANCDADGNYTAVNCDDDQQCIGPIDEGKVYCVDTDVCGVCNGPFGVFGYMNQMPISEKYGFKNADQDLYKKCSELYRGSGENAGGEVDLCYRDEESKTNSAIGQVKACSDINNCYGYRTQTSCTQNFCQINTANACEWINFTDNNELGIGACVPSDDDLVDCTKCEDSEIGCPESLCLQFGNCHYNADTTGYNRRYPVDKNHCMNIANVGCETYDTKAECIGEEKKEQEFIADINYVNGLVNSGTNAITHTSNSKYPEQTTTCYWFENEENPENSRCMKDADMSRLIGSTNPVSDDCRANEDILCFTDFQAPVTEINLEGTKFSKTQLANINPYKSDNAYSSNKIDTFYSIASKGATQGYPKLSKSQLRDEINKLDAGEYTIKYYSEDLSSNREEVKSKDVEIVQGLDLTPDIKKDSEYKIASDMWLTNVTITLTNEYQMKCDVQLSTSISNTKLLGSDVQTGTTIVNKYEDLKDDDYNLYIKCRDEFDQIFEKTQTINVEADTTIRHPYPKAVTLNTGEITIGLNTTEDATCYYSYENIKNIIFDPTKHVGQKQNEVFEDYFNHPIDDVGGEVFQNTGGKEHSTTLTYDKHEFYIYYTACDFGNGKVFVGNSGDAIFFAVDSLGPNLNLIDIDTANHVKYNSSQPSEKKAILFDCNDSTDKLKNGDNYWDFGCKEVRYKTCYQDGDAYTCDSKDTVRNAAKGWTYTFVATQEAEDGKKGIVGDTRSGTKLYLEITTEDFGGNEKSFEKMLMNVRNTEFLEPTVEILIPN